MSYERKVLSKSGKDVSTMFYTSKSSVRVKVGSNFILCIFACFLYIHFSKRK